MASHSNSQSQRHSHNRMHSTLLAVTLNNNNHKIVLAAATASVDHPLLNNFHKWDQIKYWVVILAWRRMLDGILKIVLLSKSTRTQRIKIASIELTWKTCIAIKTKLEVILHVPISEFLTVMVVNKLPSTALIHSPFYSERKSQKFLRTFTSLWNKPF